MIVELLPVVLFSQIFFFVFYVKKRRSKLLYFIEKSYHDGLISAKERDHYVEMYWSSPVKVDTEKSRVSG